MKAYETRRNIMCDGFTGIGWKMERPAATMFVWAGIPGKFKSSEEFVMALVEKAGVMVTPEMCIRDRSCIGSILIFGLGLNRVLGSKIKIGNLLPAVFLPLIACALGF